MLFHSIHINIWLLSEKIFKFSKIIVHQIYSYKIPQKWCNARMTWVNELSISYVNNYNIMLMSKNNAACRRDDLSVDVASKIFSLYNYVSADTLTPVLASLCLQSCSKYYEGLFSFVCGQQQLIIMLPNIAASAA